MAGRRLGCAVVVLLSFLLAVGSIPSSGAVAASYTATTQITLSGNLDSNTLDGDVVTRMVTIYDANGGTHPIDITFFKAPTSWDWDAGTLDSTISTAPPFAAGTATFDASGAIQQPSPQGQMVLAFTNGAPNTTIAISMAAVTSRAQPTSLTGSADGGAVPGGAPGGVPVGATGCTPASATVPVRRVTIFGRRYTPSTIRVAAGTRVCFRNGDRVKHTVTGQTFRNRTGGLYTIGPATTPPSPLPAPPSASYIINSPTLDARPEAAYPGGPRPAEKSTSFFEFLPPAEGTYAFVCTIHRGMGGLIVVGKAGARDTNPATPTPPPSGGPTPTPQPRKPALVTIFGSRFRPEKLQITVGTTVTFRNGDRPKLDGTSHRIAGTSYRDPFGTLKDWEPVRDPNNPLEPSGLTPPFEFTYSGRPPPTPGRSTRAEDARFEYTFTAAGTYNYSGELGSMRGTIVVVTPTPTP